ncbi:MAG: FecR domain-containing protein [Lentisphaeraceae bacterium]|nr:FecR domain-containing protein [Lentisphaeraceae bacterium]
MNPDSEKVFDRIIEGKLRDEDLLYLENLEKNHLEEFQKMMQLVAFEESISINLKEERSPQLFADLVIDEIKSEKLHQTQSFANKVVRKLDVNSPKSSRRVSRKPKKTASPLPFLMAAIVLIGLTVGVFFVLESKHYEVYITQGQFSSGLQTYSSGQLLPQNLKFRAESDVELSLADGTKINLDKASEVKLDLVNKMIFFQSGKLYANVQKQTDEALKFITPYATAEILGTEFSLETADEKSWLDLTEGSIRYSSKNSDKSILMKTGEEACALEQGDLAFAKEEFIKLITLVDAKTGKDLKILEDNNTISLSEYHRSFSIKAYAQKREKIAFYINGKKVDKEEENPPYILTGNAPGSKEVYPWKVKPGNYEIVLKVLSGNSKYTKKFSIKIVK